MDEYQYELLLGNDIGNIKINNSEFQSNEDNKYSISFKDNPIHYYNIRVYSMSLYTDHKERVTTINLNTPLIDETFYISLVNIYGEPDSVMVDGEVISTKKSTFKNGNVTVTKEHRKTKQGSFSDKPRFIIWRKENYLIEVFMKYDQNVSVISFRKIL